MSATYVHPTPIAPIGWRDHPLAYLAIGVSMSFGGLAAVAVGHAWLSDVGPLPIAAEVTVVEPETPAPSMAPAMCEPEADDVAAALVPQCWPRR